MNQNITNVKSSIAWSCQRAVYAFIVLVVGLGLNAHKLVAEGVLKGLRDQAPFAILSVKEGEEVSLKMLGPEADTEISIDPGNGILSTYTIKKDPTGWNNFIKPLKVQALGTTMKIYGAIRHFDCSINQSALTGIELGETPLLEVLKVENNLIDSIDLSRAATLQEFHSNGAQISSLELPNPSALKVLKCSGTNLTTLDLTHQVNLELFVADGCNNLKDLDFSSLSKLTYLSMKNNPSKTIDLTPCQALQSIELGFGQLTSLQLSSTQTALRDIRLMQSQLSACALNAIYTALPQVSDKASILVEGNEGATTARSEIAVSKGWKVDIAGDGSGCDTPAPVDKPKEGTPYVTMAVTPHAFIQMSFKVGATTDIYIETEKGTFVKETFEPIGGVSGGYAYSDMKKYKVLADTIRVYGDFLGIDCSSNKGRLTGLDLSQMSNLQDLMCQENQIETLDVSKTNTLQWLYCGKNKLSSLDLSLLESLEVVDCSENQLTEILLSDSHKLSFVSVAENQLDACALDILFSKLPEHHGGLIKIAGNPGAKTSTPQLFSEKGWKCDVLGDGTGCPDGPSGIGALVSDDATMSLYPNPVSERLHISSQKPYAEVSIYSLSGELLQSVQTDGVGAVQLDVTHLPNGAYYVVIAQKAYRFIVAR